MNQLLPFWNAHWPSIRHFLPYLLAFFITSSLWRAFYGWRRHRRTVKRLHERAEARKGL